MSFRDPPGAFEEKHNSVKKNNPDPHILAQTHASKHEHKHIP